jgi:hypothetical protein
MGKSPLQGYARKNPKAAAMFFFMALLTFFLFTVVMPHFHW